jgi:hypothetical protein
MRKNNFSHSRKKNTQKFDLKTAQEYKARVARVTAFETEKGTVLRVVTPE